MGQMNFSWVLHGALAGAEGPARVRDLLYLKQQGIGAIVRMEARTISGERADLTDLYEPVPDFNPPTIEQIQRMVLFIQEQIETRQRPVAVTCHAGIGRTGTLLACYLVHEGNSPDNAVSKIRSCARFHPDAGAGGRGTPVRRMVEAGGVQTQREQGC